MMDKFRTKNIASIYIYIYTTRSIKKDKKNKE